MGSLKRCLEKSPGKRGETSGILGGEVGASASTGTLLVHLWVTLEIVAQTCGHEFALSDDGGTAGDLTTNLLDEQWIVCASENDRIDLRLFGKSSSTYFSTK